MKILKILTLTLLLTNAFSSCSKSIVQNQITPTQLTLVVTDVKNNVIDTVVVKSENLSQKIKFLVPSDIEEIHVFAMGERVHKDISTNFYVTGLAKKLWGRGFVECQIDKGILVSITGNGAGTLSINQSIREQILADIKEAKPALITSIEESQ